MSGGYAGSSRNDVETQLQEDWNNREFINVFSLNVKKIADFLTSFELSCRYKFALMNEQLNALEKKIDFLEACERRAKLTMSVRVGTQLAGKAFTKSIKPIVSRSPEEARYRVLAVYKQWIKFIPTLNYLYRLHLPEAKLQDAIKAQFMQNAHVKDIRIIDMLVHKAEQELRSVKEAWTPGNVLLNVLFGETKAHQLAIVAGVYEAMLTWPYLRFCSSHFRVGASFRLFSLAQNTVDSSTRDPEEMRRFADIGKTWWQPTGPFKLLHSMNGIRVPWIRDALCLHLVKSSTQSATPLMGLQIAEVGCGGGLLSERMAALGAKVYGADTDLESVQVAKQHSKLNSKVAERLQYAIADIDTFSQVFGIAQFDAFVASEVLEHVGSREHFVKKSVDLVKPGGLLFYTTMNRTQLARFMAIYIAENVLGLVPKGIHDWEKFTPPEDLKSMLEQHNCTVKMIHGYLYNPLANQWFWTAYTGIHYALYAVKG
ncbi:hypothetical protein M514_09673 [Trichuris suis]|uniref:Ubiquinone biosynthesis O-methyltransferase, mitochondrial n=1 Tax=Trichuris suis TaxID=68888 RepID=A0A085N2C6_9BILA|nr:hypothetical protein M514_09673 [Trichuris suis]